MPTYCYRRPNGTLEELNMSSAEMAQRQLEDGTIELSDGTYAQRDYRAESAAGQHAGNWPMTSDAAGVHPSQIKEAMQECRTKGVPTDFTKDGQAIFRDRAHRKAYCKAYHLRDRSGGYGDHT